MLVDRQGPTGHQHDDPAPQSCWADALQWELKGGAGGAGEWGVHAITKGGAQCAHKGRGNARWGPIPNNVFQSSLRSRSLKLKWNRDNFGQKERHVLTGGAGGCGRLM